MHEQINRQQRLADLRDALGKLAAQLKATDVEMAAYLVEMALIQLEEDLVAELKQTAN